VIYCSFPAFADARTAITNYADPRGSWASAAAAQMGRALDRPCFTSCDVSSLANRPDLVGVGGLLEVSTLLSFEQMVLDHEELRHSRAAVTTQVVTPESLALEVIRDVGPGGHFLAHRHTLNHIREFITPRFVDPEHPCEPGDGAAAQSGAWEQARDEARRLLGSHRVEPLSPRLEASLECIVESAA
jgi:trimethylamine--corrinoid protein Co-methyltransferase